ncbi:maleylpyruvate isomerase N-terminal domain-containing protein [Actinoplanes sp. CA-030573]|uniref:maleylpyruvate isomerase N-terminal domain-containing protein n=1 Tax=Actinoplanes sp. CA-030573 TaxID=3239898 RepID=UPI003D904781
MRWKTRAWDGVKSSTPAAARAANTRVSIEASWTVITQQRLALAELLAGLTGTEWEHPSLCAGWRVRDVAAHVALAPQPPARSRCSARRSAPGEASTGSTTTWPYGTRPGRPAR